MKLNAASLVSTFALLLATAVVHGCPMLRASGRKVVAGGKTSFYKLRVSTGNMAIDSATVRVRDTEATTDRERKCTYEQAKSKS